MLPYPSISIQHHFLKVDVLVWMCSIAHKLVYFWSPGGEAVLEGSRTSRRCSLTGGSSSLGGEFEGLQHCPTSCFLSASWMWWSATNQPSSPTPIPSMPFAMFPQTDGLYLSRTLNQNKRFLPWVPIVRVFHSSSQQQGKKLTHSVCPARVVSKSFHHPDGDYLVPPNLIYLLKDIPRLCFSDSFWSEVLKRMISSSQMDCKIMCIVARPITEELKLVGLPSSFSTAFTDEHGGVICQLQVPHAASDIGLKHMWWYIPTVPGLGCCWGRWIVRLRLALEKPA